MKYIRIIKQYYKNLSKILKILPKNKYYIICLKEKLNTN